MRTGRAGTQPSYTHQCDGGTAHRKARPLPRHSCGHRALPIREENELDYRSCNEGVMHACGHDGHAAILLNSVRLLCRRRRSCAGNFALFFQHAEETPPGGAVEVIRAGVLKGCGRGVSVCILQARCPRALRRVQRRSHLGHGPF